ncbi:MAG: cytochrome c3 family protein [Myxococcales bacterium]
MLILRRGSWALVLACAAACLSLVSCKGDTGEQGPQGPPGEPGPPGPPAEPGLEPEPFGLVGRVMEPNLTPVPSGTVYLVPASDVQTLSETPIDIFLSPVATAALEIDEPIEDLLDTKGDTYEQADVDTDGVYRFESLPEGSHFVVWVPASDDSGHLLGGSSGAVSFTTDALLGMQMDIAVSPRQSEAATYVGSSTCMVCHGLHSTTRTAHNVGLQVPGAPSLLQDTSPWPDFNDGLAQFEAGTTLYYYDCDAGALSASKCLVSDVPPAGTVSFELRLRRDAGVPVGQVGAYYVEMVNRVATEISPRFDVVLTYGGALGRQQYLMRRTNANGRYSYFVLPLQYNYQGDFSNPNPADWPWSDYRSDLWYDFNTNTLDQPSNGQSFDNNCAGCHFTGYRLQGSEADGWSAQAIVDSEGAFDYDGDGRPELINTGCESCHGPGSEHLELSPRGSHIVQPGLITPGRQAMLCGRCHSRPLGVGGGATGLPLSADEEMPPAGIRRRDFALLYTSRVSGTPEDFFASGDAKADYQQYSDHIRARHYRNPSRLVSCTGCHNPHVNAQEVAESDTSGNPNALCTTCHSPTANPELYPVGQHVANVTGFEGHASLEELLGPYVCTECHMVPTARSGAAVPALRDTIGGPPTVQYYWNDIASHRMTVTLWDGSGQPTQPLAFTNECGQCHGEFLPNDPTP